MRGLYAIIYKELIQVRRDPATAFVFMVPVIQLLLFGFALDTDVRHIPTVVFDLDQRAAARDVLWKFENTSYFHVIRNAKTEQELYDAIVAGEAQVGIVIPPDYSDRSLAARGATIQVLIDGSDNTVASRVLYVASGVGLNASVSQLLNQNGGLMPVEVRPYMLYNPNMKSANFFVPGLVGIILQIVTLFLTAFSIVRERERGTMEQLIVTPVGRAGLMIGKLIPYAIIGMLETCFVLAAMVWIFKVPINGSLALLLLLSVLFLIPALGLGIFISTIAQNQGQAVQFSFLIMLPSILLSGFMFPRESMPGPIYAITFAIPVTYYLQILRGIILRGAPFEFLMQQSAMLAVFSVVIFTISTLRFQKRLG
jgi:drug efflux transport system permease protein/drug efflux transport system ATP-binding protein